MSTQNGAEGLSDEALVALVDDDAQIAEALKLLLSFRGIRTTAHDSAESLLAVLSHERGHWLLKDGQDGPSKPLFAAVVDLNLPGMSGVDLVLQLRTRAPELKLVIITAALDQLLLERGHELQGVTCLPKPFALEALEAALFEE